jgi:hypothetical protein
MNRTRTLYPVLVLGVVALLGVSAVDAASRFEPPTLIMMGRDNQVVVAVAEPSPEDGKVLFRRVEVLHGDMPQTVLARIDPLTADGLTRCQRYIVAYTEVRRNPLDRETRELDPAGPRVVELPAVGMAVIEDSPEMRMLFDAAKRRPTDLGRGYLEPLLALLEHRNARTRRFVIAELYLRAELFDHLKHDDLPVISDAIASPANDPESRAFLLEASLGFPPSLRGPWLGDAARTIVTAASTEFDLGSTYPLLVRNALQVLGSTGTLADALEISRQFASNSPGVAKAALAALELIDPDAAAERARELLAQGDLQQSTRQAMQQFLLRYDRGESGE